ncbi:VanZ family protein [Nostoc sphaeroides]|uniref:VanZ family protein n=1 Tax=Nostoc sphaeroides CCNUC1 TaxID=2653204 RepID=A0A5P8VVK1_9NOSO|nr:VanZ family protein [Nostoc sphaeroides]QFS44371.1 VanZ family protein [Nostoc sphaeroides CCNUC1]
MNKCPIPSQIFNLLIVITSILLVLLATLYPFNFSIPDSFYLPEIFGSFNNASNFQDQVNNFLLFMPLGFGFTRLLQKRRIKTRVQVFIVTLVSAGLSLTVEVLQIFLPSRMPTPSDILNNSIGGFIGFICFYLWNSQSFKKTVAQIENSRASRSIKQIVVFCIGYIFVTFLISLLWQNTINLSNWDTNYPLLIGNEQTRDRPWQGYMSEIYIADRAISTNEVAQGLADSSYFNNLGNSLIANYQFKGNCCYKEQTGQLPELLWQGQPSDAQEGKGVFLSSSHWLQTATPVTTLSKRISKTSEFTLSTTLATSNLEQFGPARIISISGTSLRRNLTLGQQGNDLDFRLRTPITGENGADLTLNIPNIFTDTKPHHIIITYSRATIQVYVDNLHNFYSLNLLELIPKNQRVFYYALTFIPLGFGLTILTLLAKRRLILSNLLIYGGILIPSLILEGILVSESGKNLSLKTLLLGMFFTGGTMLILRVRAAQLKMRS